MLNRLQPASRLLIRASLGVFTAIVLLLIQSAFWSTRVSGWMQAIIFALALLSYFRPHYGLLAVALLAPLGQVGSRTLDSTMRGAEALVLAFLAGALIRGWTLRGFRTFPSTRLDAAALIFGFVVAASCLEQIWFSQIQIDFAWPYAQDLLNYASRTYITSARGFGMLSRAMWLLEGMALLTFTARYVRQNPEYATRLVAVIVAGAVGTAILTVWYVGTELFATGQVQARIFEFFAARRWTVHVSDINAAGSFFAMAMFIALAMAFRQRPHRLHWLAASIMFAAMTWMTHSRTALAAMLLVLVCTAAGVTAGRVIGVWKAVAITAAAAIVVTVGLWNYLGPQYFGEGASSAVRVRWLFLGITWRMLMAAPIFGMGIGQYFLWSNHFATRELFDHYQRENAHNNFAQIAGELGWLGLASFVAVLAISLWHRGDETPIRSKVLTPMLLGLSVFILTWLGGHPLLVGEVAYPFWIALGIAAGLVPLHSATSSPPIAVTIALLLLLSIPFRVSGKSADLDYSRITYGLSTRQQMTSHARLFVPAGKSRLELPLRVRGASEEEPVAIEVLVDGSALETITVTDRNWRRAPIDLRDTSSLRFHQIDLRIRPDTIDALDPLRSTVEVGKWEIISKPNG